MEIRVEANEDNLTDARTRIGKMEKEIAFLKEKTDDLENRSRRSNVKIVNIPERAEGNDAVGYVERLLPRLFGEEHFPAPVVIERAHRLGKAAERVRPILVKFLNYRDKDKVLRLARNKGTVYLDTNRVSFYPDYSIEVQRRMAAFNEVKKKLREKNIEYASRYPAKLRIRHREGFKLFSTPSEKQKSNPRELLDVANKREPQQEISRPDDIDSSDVIILSYPQALQNISFISISLSSSLSSLLYWSSLLSDAESSPY
ncbi:hypothetical protein NFI96_001810 [Prochilodus magdalenae]|nr:hypothetical protein NFI96_001810 [Prochilodus magdalenae]